MKIPQFPPNAVSHVELSPGSEVFHCGQVAKNFLLVESGEVKVFSHSPDGRDVVLYRVGPGELCVLTTISLIGDQPYRAEAVTVSQTQAAIMSSQQFSELLNEDASFRTFVFDQLSARLADVLERMESLMFDRVNHRLVQCLLRLADRDGTVSLTHEGLAAEIGTAREVVSRHLKRLEQVSLISVHRGRIEIRDQERLRSHGRHMV